MTRIRVVGVIVAGLLAMAASSGAQTADPVGLIASGTVLPYVGAGGADGGIQVVNSLTGALGAPVQQGSIAILEVAAPVGGTSVHMFFFDQSCARVGPSVDLALSGNDSEFFNLGSIRNVPPAGLIAAAAGGTSGGKADILSPLSNPIHARVFWIDVVDGGLSRVLDPISIDNPEALSLNATYNPLRSGASFLAPLEGSTVRSTLYLACPTTNIIPGVFPEVPTGLFSTTTTATIEPASATVPVVAGGTVPFEPVGTAWIGGQDAFTYTGVSATAFTGVSGIGAVYGPGAVITSVPVPAPGDGFPPLRPRPVPATSATPLFLRVYDDAENFLRNIDILCRCWGAHRVADIDPVYSDAIQAPRGTYTEIEGEPVCAAEPGGAPACSFTGYRAIQWGGGAVGNDVFGRLNAAAHGSLRGQAPSGISAPLRLPGGGNVLR